MKYNTKILEDKMYYVLLEANGHKIASVLGVFSTPEIPHKQLEEYYGASGYTPYEFNLVEDSGIEWTLKVTLSDGNTQRLCMCSFELDKI